jgi:protein-S-isoprenylcysteine O-methyltransferase Ste14
MLVGGSALGIWLDRRWFNELFINPIFHLATFVVGLLLLNLVMRVSRYTGRLLASMGREGDLPRMDTNKLITTGVYGCMRHPMHLGLLFFPWSVALILGSPTFILVIAPLEMLTGSYSEIWRCLSGISKTGSHVQPSSHLLAATTEKMNYMEQS